MTSALEADLRYKPKPKTKSRTVVFDEKGTRKLFAIPAERNMMTLIAIRMIVHRLSMCSCILCDEKMHLWVANILNSLLKQIK